MSLFSIFKKKEMEVEPTPEVKSEKIVTIAYGTGMPIDAIYAFIKKDMEQDGYNDALCNWNDSYKASRIQMIKNELQQLFNQVRLRYKSQNRQLTVQAQMAQQQGLLSTYADFVAQQEMIAEHLQKIDEMEEGLRNEDPQMTIMIMSYERGFMRGVAAKLSTAYTPVQQSNTNPQTPNTVQL